MSMLDPEICYEAVKSRDDRFDGRIFIGVSSTGIYCRPVCPARVPKFENCHFFLSAAAAHTAGYRPCLRCRPETAPDLGSWHGTSNTVSRGLALITQGTLDAKGASVETLAERLGVGARQLRRLFQEHLGASPIAVAQARRVLFAKQLIHETRLPMIEIAFAAGFGSTRRFNEVFQKMYQRPPTALRAKRQGSLPQGSYADRGVTLRLRYRAPYDWPAILAFLRARAVEGVECVGDDHYYRTIAHDGDFGTIKIDHSPRHQSIVAAIQFPNIGALPAIVTRVRHVFDLGADVAMIGAHLARDPRLAKLIQQRPGLRVPGGWDGFELGVRAILGQQVTVDVGRRLVTTLTRICGSAAETGIDALGLVFPTAAQVASADLRRLGTPRSRRRALLALAHAALEQPSLFHRLATIEETVERLCAIQGIGDWSAHYIALRAAREPDAFPSSDIGLLRAATRSGHPRPSPGELLRSARRWRPWRAYAAQHLWASDGTA